MPPDSRTCIHCLKPLADDPFPVDNPRFCGWMCAAGWSDWATGDITWDEVTGRWHRERPDPPCYIV